MPATCGRRNACMASGVNSLFAGMASLGAVAGAGTAFGAAFGAALGTAFAVAFATVSRAAGRAAFVCFAPRVGGIGVATVVISPSL